MHTAFITGHLSLKEKHAVELEFLRIAVAADLLPLMELHTEAVRKKNSDIVWALELKLRTQEARVQTLEVDHAEMLRGVQAAQAKAVQDAVHT